MKVKCDNMLPTMMKTLMKVEFFRKMNHYSVTPAFLALNKPLIKSRVYFKILPLSSIVSPKPQPSFSLSPSLGARAVNPVGTAHPARHHFGHRVVPPSAATAPRSATLPGIPGLPRSR
jgi:hypothetical protein